MAREAVNKPTCTRRAFLKSVPAGLGAAAAITAGIGTSQAEIADTFEDYAWASYRGERGLTGSADLPGIDSYEHTHFAIGDGSITSPVVSDSIVYTGTGNELVATELTSGRGTWTQSFDDDRTFIGSPVVGDEVVAGVTADGSVVAVDRAAGDELWSRTLSGRPGFPNATDGIIFVGDDEGTVYAFDELSGELQWTQEFNARPPSGNFHDTLFRPSPAIDDDYLYVNIPNDLAIPSQVVALTHDGEVEWTRELDVDYLSPPAVTEQELVVKGRNTSLWVFSKSGGVEQWSQEFRREADYPPAVGHDAVAIVDDDSFGDPQCQLYALDTGEHQWSYTVEEGTVPAGATITEEHVYFAVKTGARDAKVVAVGLEDGLERFSVDVGNASIVYGPVPVPHGLIIPDGSKSRLTVDETFELAVTDAADTSGDGPNDDSGESDDEDTAPNDEDTTSDDDQTTSQYSSRESEAGDEHSRGFFTNNGNHDTPLFLRDAFVLTIIGLVVSIMGVVYQLISEN